tara:strand:- start:468 stop:632 length:165 start_codon:yes stop_codon:yes gene_type:complete
MKDKLGISSRAEKQSHLFNLAIETRKEYNKCSWWEFSKKSKLKEKYQALFTACL